jgi:hypothetical protein
MNTCLYDEFIILCYAIDGLSSVTGRTTYAYGYGLSQDMWT